MKRIVLCFFLSTAIFFLTFGYSTVQAEKLLKLGVSGDDVYMLQIKLKEYGFYDGAIDEVFGIKTLEAVQAFQVAMGLEADGIAGGQTLLALHEYKAKSSRGNLIRNKGNDISVFAQNYYGVPYVWGGISPNGFDCSGFIYYTYKHFGIYLPRSADEQFEVGSVVKGDLKVGDLVFFTTYEPGPSHVGIYIGNGQFIHASSAANQVTITSLSKPYYQTRYLGARRLF